MSEFDPRMEDEYAPPTETTRQVDLKQRMKLNLRDNKRQEKRLKKSDKDRSKQEEKSSGEDLEDQEFDAMTSRMIDEDPTSVRSLRKLTGKYDLDTVTYLEMCVDTENQSIEALGTVLPNLLQLRLHDSVLKSFRDLGTSLRGLQILWVARCGVTELDGIGSLTGLKELYLAFNDVSDFGPLALHDNLQLLDIESNRVADVGQLDQLGTCTNLHSLTLDANPVSKLTYYRRIVVNYVPQLETLDDNPITDEDREPVTEEMLDEKVPSIDSIDDAEYSMVTDGIKYAHVDEKGRKMSSVSRSPGKIAEAKSELQDDSSKLTHGTNVVFAGNVTSALRRRRSEKKNSSEKSQTSLPEKRESITDTLDQASDMEARSREEILYELKAWKLENPISHVGQVSNAKKPQRPQTSAGIVRPRTSAPSLASFTSFSTSPKRSSSRKADVLKLDLDSSADAKCVSPTSDRIREMNMESLSPRLSPDVKATKSPQKFLYRNDNLSDSDESDEADEDGGGRSRRRSKGGQIPFDLEKSLDAIDRWTSDVSESN